MHIMPVQIFVFPVDGHRSIPYICCTRISGRYTAFIVAPVWAWVLEPMASHPTYGALVVN